MKFPLTHTITLAITLILSALFHVQAMAAGPTPEQVISKAQRDLVHIVDSKRLVDGQALDPRWKDSTQKQIHKQTLSYYIVSFTHNTLQDTLYILLSDKGMFFGANFSGQFNQLEGK